MTVLAADVLYRGVNSDGKPESIGFGRSSNKILSMPTWPQNAAQRRGPELSGALIIFTDLICNSLDSTSLLLFHIFLSLSHTHFFTTKPSVGNCVEVFHTTHNGDHTTKKRQRHSTLETIALEVLEVHYNTPTGHTARNP